VGHKNDFRDAHAVAEAMQRPTTRFVPAKTNEQLDLQALNRVRSRLVRERTAVINQIRGFLLKRGSFAKRCPTSWLTGQTFFHHAWSASAQILPVTGGSSMNELTP
jgi:Transposase